jgi:hypothetical protein
VRSWLSGHVGRSVVAGVLAVGVVGGLAFAVAGPIMGSNASTTSSPAASTGLAGSALQAATGASVKACAGGKASAAGAATSAPGTSTPSAAAKGCGAGVLRRLLGRAVHATFVIPTKSGNVTVTLDRGAIQSISSTSITILRKDGVTVTDPISSSTKFLRASESSLAAGDHVVLVQVGGTTRYVVAIGKGTGADASSAAASASDSTT